MNAQNIGAIQDRVADGRLEVVDMTEHEMDLFADLTSRSPDHDVGLLLPLDAADEGRITPEEANDLHRRMREHGFWDSGTPFPDG